MSTSVSIIIVNYKTPKQIKLCVRSVRHYTLRPCEVVVVDNNSQDESTEYLKSLAWIRLIENKNESNNGAEAHLQALQMAVEVTESDIILIMHSDTFVRSHDWLETLLSYADDRTMIVGSQDRLVLPVNLLTFPSAGWKRRKLEVRWRKRGRAPKIISHCALYRRELFTAHGQTFDHPLEIDGIYYDAGESIQRYCEINGLGIRLLSRRELAPHLLHFEAATLNIRRDSQGPLKRQFRAWWLYRKPDIRAILADDSLDR